MFKQDLLDFSFSELEIFCKDKNLPKFRASQIWRWMYCFGLKSFLEMNNISKSTIINNFSSSEYNLDPVNDNYASVPYNWIDDVPWVFKKTIKTGFVDARFRAMYS